MTIERFDLAGIPLYNADLDTDQHRPPEVARFKQAIADADALLIATPEYNHSVPGVLQNAIDWASRPGMSSVLKGKPVGMMSASPGAIGGARAQQQLKLVLMSALAVVMPHAGVVVGQTKEKFDASGSLTHESTRQFLAAYLVDLEAWIGRVR
jgi:chromate reductase